MNTTGRRLAPFLWAAAVAVVSAPLAWILKPQLCIEIAAILFFSTYLLLIGLRFPRLTGAFLKRHAANADEPVSIIFIATLAAVVVSIYSLFSALNSADGSRIELGLAFASVALGWAAIHTMAAMHYAHIYWQPGRRKTGGDLKHGLDFPQTEEPGSYDFLYFALVIGMTAQTSDVAITTTEMRKINLAHAVISFFFNTVLVAAAVNTAVSLAQSVPGH